MTQFEIDLARPTKPRLRQRHHKSRNGCMECKRRRIKCDEAKPSCSRCVTLLHKCIYPEPQLAQQDKTPELSLRSPSSGALASPPTASLFPEFSSSSEPSTHSTPSLWKSSSRSDATEESLSLSDTSLNLYHHFLQHTCRNLNHSQQDQAALRIGMPTLALKSTTVFHTVLAVSAACICWDMITKDPESDVNIVNETLMTGYRHYNLASERMRDMIARPESLKPESLLASTILLVPFAAASQQINHWISTRNQAHDFFVSQPITLRDVVVIMRGVRTTVNAISCVNIRPTSVQTPEPDTEGAGSDSPPFLDEHSTNTTIPPSRTHAMFPILAATSQAALSKLRERLDSTSHHHSEDYHEQRPNEALSACAVALDVLADLRDRAFTASSPSPTDVEVETVDPKTAPLPQLAPWLRAYITRPSYPQAGEPLNRPFLTFLVQSPPEYLDILLPLLDKPPQSTDMNSLHGVPEDLTTVQALALDIYAHWCVFMFLVEEEAWWISKLPVMTLTGMLSRFGNDFVARLWPESVHSQDSWWPSSMLTILQQIRLYR